MSDLLDIHDKLSEVRLQVELLSMAAGDLEPEWSGPLRLGATKASDVLSDIAADLLGHIERGMRA